MAPNCCSGFGGPLGRRRLLIISLVVLAVFINFIILFVIAHNSFITQAPSMDSKELQNHSKPVMDLRLLSHLKNNTDGMWPALHIRRGNRISVQYVIGIPTVKRNLSSLMNTLTHLIEGCREEDLKDTVNVVMIGDTDIDFVNKTAKAILATFPKYVNTGFIEIIAPPPSYYPDWNTLPVFPGDTTMRIHWVTKQNLDILYLMAYGQTRGCYYLTLEDDVIAKKSYMQTIKQYTANISMTTPNWITIDYGQYSSFGKLFKSADLGSFTSFLQLFCYNQPFSWLLDNYLSNRVCFTDKDTTLCSNNKLQIRFKYKESLFETFASYTTLEEKIRVIMNTEFYPGPNHIPHENPPIKKIKSDIKAYKDFTIESIYFGTNYFLGLKPRSGNIIEFWFKEPINLVKYKICTGNYRHPNDKLLEDQAQIEIFPHIERQFIIIDSFDLSGIVDGPVKSVYWPIECIRIRIIKSMIHDIVISEIHFKKTKE